MSQKIQMGSTNDNAQARLKFFRRGLAACGADSIAGKPFSTKCEKTDANPGGVETGGGVGFEIERVCHEQYPRKNVHALIQHRIALGLFQGDQCVRDQIRNRADPAECFNDEICGDHSF